MRFLPRLFRSAIRAGRIELIGPRGETESFGGEAPGPEVTVRVTNPSLDWKIFLNPELHGAEAIMDGGLIVERGSIHELIQIFFMNKRHFDMTPTQIYWHGLWRKLRRLLNHNSVAQARQNARHHYDLGNEFYRLWLDRDMQYSCGYWEDGVETLEDAQTAKKRHIAAKLALEPGQRVLDIGSGWGGLALYLAAIADVEVTGVTLSERQLAVARARAEALGLSGRCRFELKDYRDIRETYDRIVSVGMAEHVGVRQLPTYFLGVRDCLAPDGLALIHAISSKAPPGITGPFLSKYIFPGGYSPSLSETFASIERSGLWTLDCEIWRLHYAYTLAEWSRRFQAVRDRAVALYGERFARMWEVYLSSCECVFRYDAGCVFQLQLSRARDAVPITRDYLAPAKAEIAMREQDVIERLLASTEAGFGGETPGDHEKQHRGAEAA